MSYPPTPEQHGRNVARLELLETMLRKLILLMQQALPDLAPFDMNPEQARLWQAIEDAQHLFRLSRKRDFLDQLPPEPEPDPDELDGGTA